GQIQHIVEMNSKQRREIIDSVSGVHEFEQKKEEAISELGKVEAKINDSKIVLGEREGFLRELEKEKDDALSYLEASDTQKRSKATMLGIELDKFSRAHEEAVKEYNKLQDAKKETEGKIALLEQEIKKLEGEKSEYIAKINKKSQREDAIREIAELKAGISAANAAIMEKNSSLKQLAERLSSFEGEKKEAEDKISGLQAQVKALSGQAKEKEAQIQKLGGKNAFSEHVAEAKRLHEEAQSSLSSLLQEKSKSESELSSAQDMYNFRLEEKKRLSQSCAQALPESESLRNKEKSLSAEVGALEEEIGKLFSREKELNKKIPDLDKERLELAEKAANFRAIAKPASANPALQLIAQMKGKIPGIYGTVSELISFEGEYATAVEASCSQRLNYVIVEDLDTASKAIDVLKKQKAGRCTFIPLNRKLSFSDEETARLAKSANSLGFLSDFIKYDRKFEPAMNYVFSDTLLVNTIENAKKIGFQKARMITMQGELLEKSGIITGGIISRGISAGVQLSKVEEEISRVKAQRDSFYAELDSIREEMGKKRRKKAEGEVELKSIQLKFDSLKEKEKGAAELAGRIRQIEGEAEKLSGALEEKKKLLADFDGKIAHAQEVEKKARQKIEEEEKRAREHESAGQKKLNELIAQFTKLEEEQRGRDNEIMLHKKREEEIITEAKKAREEEKKQKGEITALKNESASSQRLVDAKEEELRETGKQVQKWFDASKKIDGEIAKLAEEKGKFLHSNEGIFRKLGELDVKRATTETRLIDLKAEFEEYKQYARIEASREKLLEMIRESEGVLSALGNVNLKAPELYEQKKKDIAEIKEKVEKLADERSAVLAMISEIEKRKHAVFMETYNSIAENFKKLFLKIFKEGEEGMLVLEQPANPFEGGLSIKVKSGGREKHIESMSGGEKSLMAIVFIFAIQMHKPAPFYVLDEVDAALDKENSKKLAMLVSSLSEHTQIIAVTHNDAILSSADTAVGVTMTSDGSRVVGLQLKNLAKQGKLPAPAPQK
ncbi:hypothetical protein COV61_05095, partial [Candidatus Micrarchaeota archaeon CG11_big_fil_rev_8_21_14_0_20_47_5]